MDKTRNITEVESINTETKRIPQRVAVIGGGAVGCYMAAQAYAAGHEVTLCLRTPFQRLIVESPNSSQEIPVKITTEPNKQSIADWVLIATKTQDVTGTKPWLDYLVDSHTVIVLLQNGINPQGRLNGIVHSGFVLPGLVYIAVEGVSPGHIVHRGGNRVLVPEGEHGSRFRDLLFDSSAEILLELDFLTATWKKLLRNLAANPITALTLHRIGVMKHPDVERLAREILQEGVAVGRAAGAALDQEDIEQTLNFYAQFKRNGGTSMLYDRLARRPLEHESITGAVVSMGEQHGISTPVNRVFLTLLRALELPE
jgi:2-dehydropantoate 2-reductase